MNILFDLDGTLIDSSPSILKAVEKAFINLAVPMQHALDDNLIGPPLNELLKILSGSDDPALLKVLSTEFKNVYDSDGYKETVVFDGVDSFLTSLKQQNHRLFIVTNKRLLPTEKIISHFEWGEIFDGLYALDACQRASKKSELIAFVIEQQNLNIDECIYIGDTCADANAAAENAMKFLMVSWGYDFSEKLDYVNSLDELSGYLNNLDLLDKQ